MSMRPHVLVVDDFASMRRVIAAVLKECGVTRISEAENGRAALQVLQSDKSVGIVMSDWNMPVMDGLSLLRSIKTDPELKAIPVVMLTAEGMKENVIEAAQAGATGYIVKPFSPATVQKVLDKLFPMPQAASA